MVSVSSTWSLLFQHYQLTRSLLFQARKLKGVIDLDQCEQVSRCFLVIIIELLIIVVDHCIYRGILQVDTGLTYQSGRVSYQFMFDIKTPKRVYYLAADCEADMTAWVDWVCQVNSNNLGSSKLLVQNLLKL